MKIRRLPRSFFTKSTELVAQQLLGKLLVRNVAGKQLIGKIVETECYTFHDPASHCYQKQTMRNQALFGPVGHAYIYQIYGIHYGFNVVAYNDIDQAGGVLIRAVEPLGGMDYMRSVRSIKGYSLTNGPGKLTQAFSIDKQLYGQDLVQGQELFLAELIEQEPFEIQATARIGISKAQDYQGRFIIKDNTWVTPHRFNKMLQAPSSFS
jgi:DNA-3-methyladenine glycosylase